MTNKILKNLAYRVKRLFNGESGIVERVEDIETYNRKTKEYYTYQKDDDGNLPSKVTFRNPLGKLVTIVSRPVLKKTYDPRTEIVDHSWVYPDYKIGEEYP